jgi:outer membrane protein OmpA-like peptidoglycan-associated protein
MEAMSPPTRTAALLVTLTLVAGCAGARRSEPPPDEPERVTERDKTKKGAMIGAAGGAVLGAVIGERELDEILAGAAIGAGVGAGVGAYMDRQEEKLAQIPGTTVERVGEDMLLLHFESEFLFAVDSAQLSPEAEASLDRAAQVLMEQPKTALIAQGHTDATGSEEHNQALSERRAKIVMNYLIGQGVDAQRITAVGYGEHHPVASNETEEGRSKNRRVDLLIKAKAT